MEPIKINPLTFKPSVALGISIPFNGPGIFSSTYTTKDQVRNNLLNYFLTNKNERVFNVNFGSNLRQQIFEQITNGEINDLQDSIKYSLTNYFPQINIVSLEIIPISNAIEITLKYSINNTGITDEINIELE